MPLVDLLAWNDLSIFFYTYCKMFRPKAVLELGTGLGHSSLWIAQALTENDSGHVWTVDSGVRWPEMRRILTQRRERRDWPRESSPLFEPLLTASEFACPHDEWMGKLADVLGLSSAVSFVAGDLTLTDTQPLTPQRAPLPAAALAEPLDVVYADFDHYPHAVLTLLVKYLPLMAESSSIFIDSAATYLPSYLVLEQTLDQMNRGKLPAIFFAGTSRKQREQLTAIVSRRRFTHLALPERKDRNQNGLSWIRIEPVNVLPYPLTQVRGLFSSPLAGAAVEALFCHGEIPTEDVERAFLFEQFVRSAYPLSESELSFLIALASGRAEDAGESGAG
jgi:hypothetical protein